MIIEVADRAGVRIPRFCYHRKLSVAANCRMCLVEVERAPKPMPACATPVMDGMKIFTGSDLAVDAQRSVMEFLLINHPLDCPICDQGGECELQDVAMGYGRGVSRFTERKRVVPDKNLGPLISTDMTRCIHCTRCVRFGVEVAGLPELGATGRGEHLRIGTFVERSVDSELSGNVIDVCPVGALTSKPFRFSARAWEMTQRETIAAHDGVGSNLYAHVKGAKVMRVVPRDNESVNEVWISDRDRFSYTGLYADDRLMRPRVKRDGEWVDTDWDVALEHVAEQLRGRDATKLGALASPSSTVEEHFLLQKVMRGLGSSNIDHRLRMVDTSDQADVPAYPHIGQSIEGLEQVDAALLIGSNCRKEQPLINHRLRKAALRGASIMAVNAARYDANYDTGPQAVVSPADMARAMAGIAKALIDAGATAGDDIGIGLDEVMPTDDERAIASALHAAQRPTILLGHLALAHPHASALRALGGYVAALAGGTYGVLADGANAAGAALAGALPHRGPGGSPLGTAGMPAAQMLDSCDAFVLLNVEPEFDCADGRAALGAMDGAEFVVALTAYCSEAMEAYADVLLPIAPFAETAGSYVNLEGQWQSVEAVVRPQGEARAAWRVLRVLGNALNLEGFEYRDSGEVAAAVRELAPDERPDNRGKWRTPEALSGAGTEIWRAGEVPMYAVDPVVRRALPLQQTVDAGAPCVTMNGEVAAAAGITDGARVKVSQGAHSIELGARIDARVGPNCVLVPSGVAETGALGAAIGPVSVTRAGGGD